MNTRSGRVHATASDLGLCLREPSPDRLGTSFEILLAPSGAPALHPVTAMSYNV